MATGTLRIRHGKLADLAQIKEFTKDTFGWGDYLPGAWQNWVRSKRGDLLVAVIDKQVVGTVHVRYLEHKEAWLEGVRVRHAFRQRGIASLLIQAAHNHATRAKCRVIRLETSLHNTAGQRTFAKFGYQRVVHYDEYQAIPAEGALDGVRLAKRADLDPCWDLWQTSWIYHDSRAIVPAPYGWRWWKQTRKRLAEEIRAERAWMTEDAFLLVHSEDDGLDVKLVVGAKRGAAKLLKFARVLAHRDHHAQVSWIAPHTARVRTLAAAANYILDDDDFLIYARAL